MKRPRKELRRIVFEIHFDAQKRGVICPYTGQLVTENMVATDQVELDHIIPKAYGGSDHPDNLTLCLARANREKAGRTPFEAFGQTAHWPAMCKRIKSWPPEKQTRFKAKDRQFKRQRSINQNSLDMTSYFSRKAQLISSEKFPDARVTTVSSQKVQNLRGRLNLEKDRNDLRHHTLDAGLINLIHEEEPDTAPFIARQILCLTKPAFVATTMSTQAKSGALARYHNHLDIVAKPSVSKWQINQCAAGNRPSERKRPKNLIMRVRKGDVLHLPSERSGQKFLRIFRLQPSNGTIALGAPYLAGKIGETPLVVKSAPQLQKLGAVKCRQMPLGYKLPA